jgi:hypothetical protein
MTALARKLAVYVVTAWVAITAVRRSVGPVSWAGQLGL